MALKALEIKEANGKVISLKSVPSGGATALIPVPPVTDPHDVVSVSIAGDEVVSDQPVGVEEGGFYTVLISRTKLLEHLGAEQTFDYVMYFGGVNPLPSDPTDYDITH